jgi:hypothetical protein
VNLKENFVIGDFIEGSAIIFKKQDLRLIKGLMFEDGSTKFYDVLHFGHFNNGLALIDTGKKMGYLNRKGEFFIPPKYDQADDFSEGRAFVQEKDRTLLINASGELIDDFEKIYITGKVSESFAQIGLISDDGEFISTSYVYKNGDIVGFFDEPKKIIDPHKILDEEDDLSCELARFSRDNLYGFRSVFFKEIIEPIFDFAGKFMEGLASVHIGKRAGFINTNGDVQVPVEFEFVNSFSEGYAAVEYQGKMGCVNTEGEPVFPFEFDWLGHFKDGLIDFVKNDRWGLIDKDLNIIVPEIYDGITHFIDGICEVQLNGRKGVRDKNGNELFSDFITGSEYHLLN